MTFSAELTYISKSYPHEFDRVTGEAMVRIVQDVLKKILPYGLVMNAKLDPQRGYGEEERFCIEVVPFFHWETHWLYDKDWKTLRRGLTILFREMKKLGLVPAVTTRENGVEKEWPGGGCHIHYGMDFYLSGPNWYKQMEKFHRALVVDYANRPYIRWLFKQWFADNSALILAGGEDTKKRPSPDTLFKRSFANGGLEARFMATNKNTYPTFEFRQFSMIHNPDELKAIVSFVRGWTKQVEIAARQEIRFTLTTKQLRNMQDLRKARKICRDFIVHDLGLDWKDYEVFFNRNYVKRARFGKFV